jgi:uncharacterized repeat protein (TIGR01451 family)
MLIFSGGQIARAATVTVNTAADSMAGGTCSLRQAIIAANTDTATGGCAAGSGADAIVFSANVVGTITLDATLGHLPEITEDLAITGPTSLSTLLTIDATAVSNATTIGPRAVISIGQGVVATIENLKITGGRGAPGGGILNQGNSLTLKRVVVEGNSSITHAGGIYNALNLILHMEDVIVRGNTAPITPTNVSSGGAGGGIVNAGTMTMIRSTVSGNSALVGGGIFNGGEAGQQGNLTMINVTISGNVAGGSGGGIYNTIHPTNPTGKSTINMTHVTLDQNSANVGGGIHNYGNLNIKNSIVANSGSGGNCVNTGGTFTFNAVGANLATDGSCGGGFTQVPSMGPGGLNLGSLTNNGGLTETHALGTTPLSAAIDQIILSDCTDLNGTSVATDQRGVTRPQPAAAPNDRCDIGAYEVKAGKVIVKKVMVNGTGTFTFTGTPNGTIAVNGGTITADVAPGTYTSTEQLPTGQSWTTTIQCDHPNSTGAGLTATFNVGEGETVTCTFTNTLQLPDLTINKQVVCSGPLTSQGIQCQVTFTITNNGSGLFSGYLGVDDTITPSPAPPFSWASPPPAAWMCSPAGQPNVFPTFSCSTTTPITLNAAGGSMTLIVDIYLPPGQYVNCATVSGYAQPPFTPTNVIQEANTNNNQHCLNFQAGRCDLQITKIVDASPPFVPFKVTVRNVGTAPCSPPITVTDTLPPGFTPSAPLVLFSNGWTCSPATPSPNSTITCTYNSTMPPGIGPWTDVFAILGTIAPGPITNCATVDSPDDPYNSSNPGNNQSCARVIGTCDLKIVKTVTPNPVTSGGQVQVKLTVQNVGNATCLPGPLPTPYPPGTLVSDPATPGLIVPLQVVTVTLQPGPLVAPVAWGCAVAMNAVNCNTLDPIQAGYHVAFAFAATVNAPLGQIQNCSTVTNANDTNPANNQSCVTINVIRILPPIDLTLTKLLDGVLRPEAEVTYVLRIFNAGGSPTTGAIRVTDPLPPQLRFISATGTGWRCSVSGQNVTCTSAARMAPSQSMTILLRVRVAAPADTQITNCATVETAGDANPANNRGCHTGTVQR